MSSFNSCVALCLVLVVGAQSYVVRQKASVSFVDTSSTSSKPQTVETADREGLNAGDNKCAIGYKKSGPACLPDEDYTSMEYRYGLTGGFNKNCPEGYKRVDTSCVPHDSDSKEELNEAPPEEVEQTEVNKCPVGFRKAGSACIRDEDDESYEDE